MLAVADDDSSTANWLVGVGVGPFVGTLVGFDAMMIGGVGVGLTVGLGVGRNVGTEDGLNAATTKLRSFSTSYMVTLLSSVAFVAIPLLFAMDANAAENDPLPDLLKALTNCDLIADSSTDTSSLEYIVIV